MSEEQFGRDAAATARSKRSWWPAIFDLIIALAIVGGGLYAATALTASKPRAKRHPAERRAALVEISPVHRGARVISVVASGTVMPAREVALYARVAGSVVERSAALDPGGLFEAGDEVLRLDPKDYKLAVARAASALTQALAAARLEEGSRSVAKREAAMLAADVEIDVELVEREPQRASAQAAVASARAALESARLELARTRVEAPFDLVVRSRAVDVGSRISSQTPLAMAAGTETWWVEVRLPADQLRWIEIGTSKARVYDEASWPKGTFRDGRVVRQAPGLEGEGRLARIYVEVDDPMGLTTKARRLLLGAWVRVEIDGIELRDVVELNRSFVRDGDRAWVMNEQNALEVRKLDIAHAGPTHALVTDGLTDGDRVVTTDLSAPVAGMKLRTPDMEAAPKPPRAERHEPDRGHN